MKTILTLTITNLLCIPFYYFAYMKEVVKEAVDYNSMAFTWLMCLMVFTVCNLIAYAIINSDYLRGE